MNLDQWAARCVPRSRRVETAVPGKIQPKSSAARIQWQKRNSSRTRWPLRPNATWRCALKTMSHVLRVVAKTVYYKNASFQFSSWRHRRLNYFKTEETKKLPERCFSSRYVEEFNLNLKKFRLQEFCKNFAPSNEQPSRITATNFSFSLLCWKVENTELWRSKVSTFLENCV